MDIKPLDYPPVTEELYQEAVYYLLKLAKSDTGGSRVAAQVLLSAYNGQEWQVDLADIGYLDYGFYAAVLTVIRGRVELRKEPHLLIEDGSVMFVKLAERWARLHVQNRWKPNCSRCWGRGLVPEFPDDPDNESMIDCPDCHGRGW